MAANRQPAQGPRLLIVLLMATLAACLLLAGCVEAYLPPLPSSQTASSARTGALSSPPSIKSPLWGARRRQSEPSTRRQVRRGSIGSRVPCGRGQGLAEAPRVDPWDAPHAAAVRSAAQEGAIDLRLIPSNVYTHARAFSWSPQATAATAAPSFGALAGPYAPGKVKEGQYLKVRGCAHRIVED